MLSLSRHTTLASRPRGEYQSLERAREVNSTSVVKVGDVGVVCSNDAIAVHMKAGLANFVSLVRHRLAFGAHGAFERTSPCV
jgi:hypothetical protein